VEFDLLVEDDVCSLAIFFLDFALEGGFFLLLLASYL
jgi:hypothetical protein